MKIEKNITTVFETKDTRLLDQCYDKKVIMEALTQTYRHKNFDGIFITDIISINNDVIFINDYERCSGLFRASLMLTVQGIIYDKYEVITNAKVINIDERGAIYLESDNTVIVIGGKELQYIKKGDLIPVRSIRSTHKLFDSSITVQGYPFSPIYIDTTFDIKINSIAKFKKPINELIKLHKELKKHKNYKKMVVILHTKSKSKSKEISILDIPLKTNITVSRNFKDVCFGESNLIISECDQKLKLDNKNSKMIIESLINDTKKDLLMLQGLLEYHSPTDKFWTLYKKYK